MFGTKVRKIRNLMGKDEKVDCCDRVVWEKCLDLMTKFGNKSVLGFITLEGWLIFFCLYYSNRIQN